MQLDSRRDGRNSEVSLPAAQLLGRARTPRRRMRTRVRANDVRAVSLLLAIAVIGWTLPALLGHPPVTGDNLAQNLSLRALVGSDLRHGIWPLWNPYIWSGSPLLGAMNAGALYPLTGLFALMSPVSAFVVNLVAMSAIGSVGVYALGRHHHLGVSSSVLGALTFELGGASVAQSVHLGVAQGISWLPWLILSILRIGDATLGRDDEGLDFTKRSRSSSWTSMVGLGLVIGMLALSGEPRAMAYGEILVPVAAVYICVAKRPVSTPSIGQRLAFLAKVAFASAWGVALGAIQLLPGHDFAAISQRSHVTAWLFSSGSLPPSWSALFVVPDLFGGGGTFALPTWFNSYNIPEVTGYVGLVAVGSALALFTWTFKKRGAQRSRWGLYLLIVIVGLLLAYGGTTPLKGLLLHLPFYARTRLQSRDVALVDLGLAMCVSFFINEIVPRDLIRRSGTLVRTVRRPSSIETAWRLAFATPALGAIGLIASVLVAPITVETAFGTTALSAAGARSMWPMFLVQGVIALSILAICAAWRRIDRSGRLFALSVIIVADLGFFLASSIVDPYAGDRPVGISNAAAAAIRSHGGRVGIYDTAGANLSTLFAIGQPDTNVTVQIRSVQGYGSIVSARYTAATASHTRDALDPCALRRGVFDQLDLHSLYVTPTLIAPLIPDGAPPPAPPAACQGAPSPGDGTRRNFYFGREIRVWIVHLAASTRGIFPTVRVGLIERGGVVFPSGVVSTVSAGSSFRLAHPHQSIGIVIEGSHGASASSGALGVSDAVIVDAAGGRRYALDGVAQDALDAAWVPREITGGVERFTTRLRHGGFWLQGNSAGGSVALERRDPNSGATFEVRLREASTLVRSEAFAPGWTARIETARTHRTVVRRVERHGLIQSVALSPGRSIVTFEYTPPGWRVGSLVTATAVGGLVAVGGLRLARRRRRGAVL